MLALIEGIIDCLPELIKAIISLIPKIIQAIVDAGIKITLSIIRGIVEALPQLIQGVIDMIPEIVVTSSLLFKQVLRSYGRLLRVLVKGHGNWSKRPESWHGISLKEFGKASSLLLIGCGERYLDSLPGSLMGSKTCLVSTRRRGSLPISVRT